MTRVTCAVATVVCLALPAMASAQAWEAAVFFGTTPSAGLDRQSPDLEGVDIRGGYTWGLQAARFLTSRLAAEVLWTKQRTALQLTTAAGSVDLFEMTLDQIHGNAVFHLRPRNARTRPFVFAGLGATLLDASYQPRETKLSFGLGGGAEIFFWKTLGVRGQFRYKPTRLADEDTVAFCDPFGFCQGTLQQVDFTVGAVVRF
jgi:opacity protein-like surface antigen